MGNDVPIIRRATRGDAPAIADIYNHYVQSTTVTFDTEIKTAGEREEWLLQHGEAHPVLVAEDRGVVVAWGSLSPWHARPAYGGTVEVSVYVAHDRRGSGLGPILMEALVDAAVDAGHHALMSQIVADNEASLRLAQRSGFEEVGRLIEVGRKFDRWLDVVLLERIV